ncbi:MAG TPA: carboxypeptidase regulatory-like domain-containing protein [Verrucomicrobiae bacterium]|nr:carboxypeptidase regulatory-like domain-containing protein [Verrucomicrobiae bacterium]
MKDIPIPKFLGAILVLCFGVVFCNASPQAGVATPYTITGKVTTTNGTPLADVVVFATTYINGTNYEAVNGVTGSNGMYTVHVTGNSEWFLTPDCYQNSNNLRNQGYLCLDSEYIKIGSTNGSANFATVPYSDVIDELDGTVFDADQNPFAGVTVYAVNPATGETIQTTTDVNGFYYFFVLDETSWNLHVDCDQLSIKGYSCPGTITNAIIRDRNTCCQNFTVQPGAPTFFTGEVALDTPGWYWLGPQGSDTNGFGYFSAEYAPYIFHQDLGWEYFIDAANAGHGAYFYDFTDDVWWYTETGLFPYMYDFNLKVWVFCAPQNGKTDSYQSNPRWFLNTSTKQWVNDL